MLNVPLVRVAFVRFHGFAAGIRLPQRALNCATVPSKLSDARLEYPGHVLRMPTPGAAMCTADVPVLEKGAITSVLPVAPTQMTFAAFAPPSAGGRWNSQG